MKVVITGFEPFAWITSNPSGNAVNKLSEEKWAPASDVDVEYLVLPVDTTKAKAIMEEVFKNPPDIIIHLGVAADATGFRLETQAHNVFRDGWIMSHAIEAGGPDVVFTKLPTEKMAKALDDKALPHYNSDSAGKFLCNFISYTTAREIEKNGYKTKSCFVHIPLTRFEADIAGAKHFLMEPDKLMEGLKLIVDTCVQDMKQECKVAPKAVKPKEPKI